MSEQKKQKTKKVVRKVEASIEDLAKHADKETYFATGRHLSVQYRGWGATGVQTKVMQDDPRVRKLFKISGIDMSDQLLPNSSTGKVLTFRMIQDMTYKQHSPATLKDKTYICFDYTDVTTIFMDTDNLRDVFLSIKDKGTSRNEEVYGDFFYLEKIA